jgi:hypothetical protein
VAVGRPHVDHWRRTSEAADDCQRQRVTSRKHRPSRLSTGLDRGGGLTTTGLSYGPRHPPSVEATCSTRVWTVVWLRPMPGKAANLLIGKLPMIAISSSLPRIPFGLPVSSVPSSLCSRAGARCGPTRVRDHVVVRAWRVTGDQCEQPGTGQRLSAALHVVVALDVHSRSLTRSAQYHRALDHVGAVHLNHARLVGARGSPRETVRRSAAGIADTTKAVTELGHTVGLDVPGWAHTRRSTCAASPRTDRAGYASRSR